MWSKLGVYFDPSMQTSLFLDCNTGMDAQVAYGFHHLRNEKPYLAQGPITNKVCFLYHFIYGEITWFFLHSITSGTVDFCLLMLMYFNLRKHASLSMLSNMLAYSKSSNWILLLWQLLYSGYSCTQGWFFTPCTSVPSLRFDIFCPKLFVIFWSFLNWFKIELEQYSTWWWLVFANMCFEPFWIRGLKNILRIHVKKVNCSEWEQIPVPSRYASEFKLLLYI